MRGKEDSTEEYAKSADHEVGNPKKRVLATHDSAR
jgi:hypothetical protein